MPITTSFSILVVAGVILMLNNIITVSYAEPIINIDQDPALIEHYIIITVTDFSHANNVEIAGVETATILVEVGSSSMVLNVEEVGDSGVFVHRYVRLTTSPGGYGYDLLSDVGQTVSASLLRISSPIGGETPFTGIIDTANILSATQTGQEWANRYSNTQKPAAGTGGPPYDPLKCYDFGADIDGICDNWEIYGSPGDPNGGLLITFPAGADYRYPCDPLCPSPEINDIYIEVDYMQGHYPDLEAIEQVKQVFADRDPPIQLHVQIDEMALPHAPTTYFPGYNGEFSWGFDQVKARWNGTNSERDRDDDGNIDSQWTTTNWKAKKQAFHYALFVHKYATDPLASGVGEVWGNDFMVSLGAFAGEVGTTDEQAATFMHELGHNLKLNHGGAWTDKVNCKPQYISIMNYAYQMKNFDPNRQLDFSSANLGTLSESSLNENAGITTYGNPPRNVVYGPELPDVLPVAGPSIDWDQDENMESESSADINALPGCGTWTNTQYSGYNDWGSFDYRITSMTSNFAEGASAESSEPRTASHLVTRPPRNASDEDNFVINSMATELTKKIDLDQKAHLLTKLERIIKDLQGNENSLKISKALAQIARIRYSVTNNNLEQAIDLLEAYKTDWKYTFQNQVYQKLEKHADSIIATYESGLLVTPTDVHRGSLKECPAEYVTINDKTVDYCDFMQVFFKSKIYTDPKKVAAHVPSHDKSDDEETDATDEQSETTILIPSGSSMHGCEDTDDCFIPSTMTIQVGDTITWINNDITPHTIVSGTRDEGADGVFDSGIIMPGEKFEHMIDEEGEYQYFCSIHPWTEGMIIVE